MADNCRRPSCDNESRERGELQYPDDPEKTASNGERFRVSAHGARFCSDKCELKYEHAKADARDAREQEEREPREEKPVSDREFRNMVL